MLSSTVNIALGVAILMAEMDAAFALPSADQFLASCPPAGIELKLIPDTQFELRILANVLLRS
jgi:hypothetical protein